MKVVTIYAHNDPQSFCHGVLERFTAGLQDAGHSSDVIDLYADNFDPVFRARDVASYISGDIPADILARMDLRARVLRSCRWPGQRWLAERAVRGKSQAEIAALIRAHMPKDVLAYQAKVAAADGLAFIAPIHFCNFPSILKGWIDRVWTLDFAFGLTSAGWHGDVNGRIPLLHHKRALIMTSTIFNKDTTTRASATPSAKSSTSGACASQESRTSNTSTSTPRLRPPRTPSAGILTGRMSSARRSNATLVPRPHQYPTTTRPGRAHDQAGHDRATRPSGRACSSGWMPVCRFDRTSSTACARYWSRPPLRAISRLIVAGSFGRLARLNAASSVSTSDTSGCVT